MVCLIVTLLFLEIELVMEKTTKEKTMPFGINCNEKPSIIPGCPGACDGMISICMLQDRYHYGTYILDCNCRSKAVVWLMSNLKLSPDQTVKVAFMNDQP